MSYELSFFLVLVILYIIETLRSVPADSVIFSSYLGRWFKIRFPGRTFGILNRGITAGNPFPLFGMVFKASFGSLLISPEAVKRDFTSSSAFSDNRNQNRGPIRIDGIDSIRVSSNTLLINDRPLADFLSPGLAEKTGALLNRLRAEPISGREDLITDFINMTFDSRSISSEFARFRHETLLLRLFCGIQFISLFMIAPYLVFSYGFSEVILPVVITTVCYSMMIGFIYYFTHLGLFGPEGIGRAGSISAFLVYPLASIRAADNLSYDYLTFYNPMAVAGELCPRKTFEKLAGVMIRELRFPVKSGIEKEDSSERGIETWWSQKLLDIIGSYLEGININIDDLAGPPPAMDDSTRSYCPRCLHQYSIEEGDCPDCHGVSLKSI